MPVKSVIAGKPAAHVTKEFGISRAAASWWLCRCREEGFAGLINRSSRPRDSPTADRGVGG
ncbi:helix-turn-helix domain-containing protein [Nesterenkonia sp. E16_7]|uniref:helix-turn-helix domain-containing protein n=1 Tax=unclassified Nesterenkonia TaxID=2629769 RepID=UPI001A937F1F|nr:MULTISPECIES: leucine zipper domain-containing protein [unclassified Nesterenkonia]MBO0596156.1 helix-turn-helix domain-containing protein [Nesterenkonia sp. E16_10]MBO0599240.1 helix-turn-helix domain-containing protein [Nesterenkonia sp. E16_7]